MNPLFIAGSMVNTTLTQPLDHRRCHQLRLCPPRKWPHLPPLAIPLPNGRRHHHPLRPRMPCTPQLTRLRLVAPLTGGETHRDRAPPLFTTRRTLPEDQAPPDPRGPLRPQSLAHQHHDGLRLHGERRRLRLRPPHRQHVRV